MIDIIGVPRVYLSGDTFTDNSDAYKEGLTFYNTLTYGPTDTGISTIISTNSIA